MAKYFGQRLTLVTPEDGAKYCQVSAKAKVFRRFGLAHAGRTVLTVLTIFALIFLDEGTTEVSCGKRKAYTHVLQQNGRSRHANYKTFDGWYDLVSRLNRSNLSKKGAYLVDRLDFCKVGVGKACWEWRKSKYIIRRSELGRKEKPNDDVSNTEATNTGKDAKREDVIRWEGNAYVRFYVEHNVNYIEFGHINATGTVEYESFRLEQSIWPPDEAFLSMSAKAMRKSIGSLRSNLETISILLNIPGDRFSGDEINAYCDKRVTLIGQPLLVGYICYMVLLIGCVLLKLWLWRFDELIDKIGSAEGIILLLNNERISKNGECNNDKPQLITFGLVRTGEAKLHLGPCSLSETTEFRVGDDICF